VPAPSATTFGHVSCNSVRRSGPSTSAFLNGATRLWCSAPATPPISDISAPARLADVTDSDCLRKGRCDAVPVLRTHGSLLKRRLYRFREDRLTEFAVSRSCLLCMAHVTLSQRPKQRVQGPWPTTPSW